MVCSVLGDNHSFDLERPIVCSCFNDFAKSPFYTSVCLAEALIKRKHSSNATVKPAKSFHLVERLRWITIDRRNLPLSPSDLAWVPQSLTLINAQMYGNDI